ncbi:hypothetical protein [Rathayibacter sp. VKM Ac-2630]|uniref:hypothetical protein n=1 Tax=Rathayibacter sp. VKM Ac-2630 TaxID=1938617 RepID=UPI0009809FEC|nr:hypothetical protein [Rathayibacter sp. VKM Ac-2630]
MTTTTRRKPADSAETPVQVEEEYDFDSWDQEREDAALRALTDVRYIIVEDKFVGRFTDRHVVKIPLKLTTSTIDELEAKFSTPLDQFRHLLSMFYGEEEAAALADRSLIEVAIMTEKFFRALKRAQELAFPES